MAIPADHTAIVVPTTVVTSLDLALHPYVLITRCHRCGLATEAYHCPPCRRVVRHQRAWHAVGTVSQITLLIAALVVAGFLLGLGVPW